MPDHHDNHPTGGDDDINDGRYDYHDHLGDHDHVTSHDNHAPHYHDRNGSVIYNHDNRTNDDSRDGTATDPTDRSTDNPGTESASDR